MSILAERGTAERSVNAQW